MKGIMYFELTDKYFPRGEISGEQRVGFVGILETTGKLISGEAYSINSREESVGVSDQNQPFTARHIRGNLYEVNFKASGHVALARAYGNTVRQKGVFGN